MAVWNRQVGADGLRNELPRDRYHVRLINLSRFLDEAATDAYIQKRFQGTYQTWQEPTITGQIPQTRGIYSSKVVTVPSFW
ncbi:hypothetical protein L917_00008, partial [Phytophthora nicotianae]